MDWMANAFPVEGRAASQPRAGDRAQAVPTCGLADQVGGVRRAVEAAGSDRAVVVNEAGVIAGALPPEALRGEPAARAEDVMHPGPATFRPGISVEELSRWLTDHGRQSALLSDSEGRLMGLFRMPKD